MVAYNMFTSHPPSGITTHTIILLHDRDSTGIAFAEALFFRSTAIRSHSAFENTKWLFPTAPSSFSEQCRKKITEWFDLPFPSDPYKNLEEQMPGLKKSIQSIRDLIEDEIDHDIPISNIVLGGMGQGYATAVHVLNSYLIKNPYEPLAGFLGISGWMPNNPVQGYDNHDFNILSGVRIPGETMFQGIKMPIMLMHNKDDEVIDIELGREVDQAMDEFGIMAKWREYESGGHALTDLMCADICDFLVDIVQYEEYEEYDEYDEYDSAWHWWGEAPKADKDYMLNAFDEVAEAAGDDNVDAENVDAENVDADWEVLDKDLSSHDGARLCM